MEHSCLGGDIPEVPAWVAEGGFVPLIIGIISMIWSLSFICEEYCIPSITIFCKRNHISDDVAGSIFIGMGLSLPVLFASFVGLFVSHSAIGVGTVVGGDAFNNLINMALSIHVAPDKTLKLDAIIFTREMLLCLFSYFLLLLAVEHHNLSNAFLQLHSMNQWTQCLTVPWGYSLILVVCYILYCAFDSYFQRIMGWFRKFTQKPTSPTRDLLSLHPHAMTVDTTAAGIGVYMQSLNTNDSTTTTQQVEMTTTLNNCSGSGYQLSNGNTKKKSPTRYNNLLNTSEHGDDALIANSTDTADNSVNLTDQQATHMESGSVSSGSTANDTALGEAAVDFSDFQLYLKSTFYTTNDIGCFPSARQWKLRYFTFDEHGLRYRLEEHLGVMGPHVRFIDIFDLESIEILDGKLMEFCLRLRNKTKYYLRAPDSTVFNALLNKFLVFIDHWKVRSEGERTAMALKSMYEVSNGFDAALVNPDSECVADDLFIVPANPFSKVGYFLMFPLKYAIYMTVPDVRRPGSEDKAILAICLCVVWLGLQSYVLIVSLSLMGNWLGIRGRIMGLTVGAWAASYPALWSSIVVARNGYGDVASCNALGSNVFSNYIGMGLPWLVYSFVYKGRPYGPLADDGVVMSILMLVGILLLYYAMVALNGWTLKGWMVPVLGVTYCGYIGYLIYVMWSL